MREHVKHQWNYSMNMTSFNAEQAQNSTHRMAQFKALQQQQAQSFKPHYKAILNTLEIKQMDQVLQIGEDSLLTVSSLKSGDTTQFAVLSEAKAKMITTLNKASFQQMNLSSISTLLMKSYTHHVALEVRINNRYHIALFNTIILGTGQTVTFFESEFGLKISLFSFRPRPNLQCVQNPQELYFTLRDIWHGFLTTVGRESKDDFVQLVDLVSESARKVA